MEEILKCEICDGNEFADFMQCTDYFLTKERFFLKKCKNCGLVFVNPRPEIQNLKNYYESPDYISHSGSEKGIVNKIYKRIRQITHNKKYKLVNSFSTEKNILDIGSGSGELLSLFKKNNWETLGMEPNSEARKFSIKQYGIEVIDEKEIDKIPYHSFGAITLWHVLEHVPELNKRVQEMKKILSQDGFLFIAVPHHESYDAEYYKKFWAAYDVPRHLYHFTPNTLGRLLQNHGFEIVKTIPMKFDSYYVSLLSEKYKNGKQKLFNGFCRGYISNKKAGKHEYSYSSQIYVIKNSVH
ncbi:MAG: class I SAM-dependent methyltransferase [Bacteroidota bacterium]